MKRFAALLMLPLWFAMPLAHADIDGSVPSPGNCSYPGVSTFGADFGEYDFSCAYPTEINGSHWQVLFGGGMWQVQAGMSFSLIGLGVSAGVVVPAGALRGITYFACPDLSFADPPNPPGAWKNELHPPKCKSVGPRPELLRDEPEPPRPPALGLLAPPAPPPALPNVTDPAQGNTFAPPPK